nr:PhnD/SsuA/transferrin family substrate-binding protein [Anaerolineae bacterium]
MSVFRIATFLAPNVYPAYQAIANQIEVQLGFQTELVVGDTHDQFEAIAPDLAFICGLPYVLMRRQSASIEAIAAPVLRGNRYGGKPIYYSDVIVRAESVYTCFSDLRGCSWAYNEQVSQSGYGITRHTLLTL